MKGSKLISGSIFEVPLMNNYGYAYCKLVLHERKYDDYIYVKKLVYTYDRFSTQPGEIKVFDLEKENFVFEPKLLTGKPRLRGEGKWKKIGESLVNANELVPPKMKVCYQLGLIGSENPNNLDWYLVEDFIANKLQATPFREVKGLPFSAEINYQLLNAYITMKWILKRGDEISNIFSDQDYGRVPNLTFIHSLVTL